MRSLGTVAEAGQTDSPTAHVVSLRAALVQVAGEKDAQDSTAAAARPPLWQQRQRQQSVDAAAQPLINRVYRPLLRYCDILARGAPRARIEADDLAQEAWRKALRYLAGPDGARVQDDAHFQRLLRVAAKTRLLDVLERAENAAAEGRDVEMDAPLVPGDGERGETRQDRIMGSAAHAPETLLLPREGPYLRLVEELFADAEAFHRQYRQPNQRQPRQYQALVLYQIGTLFREEALGGNDGNAAAGHDGGGDAQMAHLLRHYVELIGVPDEAWQAVEQAARRETQQPPATEEGLYENILDAVNVLCGTSLRTRGVLAVLRHEMNRFAAAATKERKEDTITQQGQE